LSITRVTKGQNHVNLDISTIKAWQTEVANRKCQPNLSLPTLLENTQRTGHTLPRP